MYFNMAPRSNSGARLAPVLRGLLVVAALSCVAVEASYREPASGVSVGVGLGLDVKLGAAVKVTVHNHALIDVRLVLGVATGKVLDCKKGSVAVLGPVRVRLEAVPLLRVDVFALNGKGQLLKVKATAQLDLGYLVADVHEVVLTVREDVKAKVVTLLDAQLKVVAKLDLKLCL